MDRTTKLLSKVLDFRTVKQSVISGNLANADTPGYIPRDIPFEKALQRAVSKGSVKLNKTNHNHISIDQKIFTKDFNPRDIVIEDGKPNELNIDNEMAKMAQNNLLYEASVKLLSKKFEALKTVITESRR
jgi:flagellar basal-body rod protein FlgB